MSHFEDGGHVVISCTKCCHLVNEYDGSACTCAAASVSSRSIVHSLINYVIHSLVDPLNYISVSCLLCDIQGHYVRMLGEIGDKNTENEVLLLEHDIPHARFSDDVLSCLPQLPWTITEEVATCWHDGSHLTMHRANGVMY